MEIHKATPEDSQAIVDLFRNYRFALQHRQWLEWKYHANPAGDALHFKILANGRIAGAVAIIPQRFTYRGHEMVGLQTVDGLLGMEVRGKGNFNRLMHFLTTQKPPGVPENCFYLSFPSLAASVKAHENAGWQRISNFGLITCVLTPESLFRKRGLPIVRRALEFPWSAYRKWLMGPRNGSVQILPCGDSIIDFNQLIDFKKISGDRSRAFMKWRIDNNPRDRIHTLLIYDKEKWAGYAVIKIVGHTAEIVELRLKTPKKAHIHALMRHIHTNQWGDTIDFWCFGSSALESLFRGVGFIRRSFSGAFFVHNTGRLGLPADPKRWDITYLDSDW